ncbi:cell number regulator 8-like [Rhodamnia argentea]|uniref:Cell number regulator 8-like n=1 Tax=Rhodamnia argentea TaxID=178133 RepID=A0ABM3GU55_9MYRT|nr:cell number regulator 8-like [Rhodamnia argentea]
MAKIDEKNCPSLEESSPLLEKEVADDPKKPSQVTNAAAAPPPAANGPVLVPVSGGFRWTADGLPLAHGSVMGEPMERKQWNSCLFACLGRNDEFCSSDLEVCLLGSVAPCVLYGTNVERLGSTTGTFATHCLPYAGLYLIGKAFCRLNCIAPMFSFHSRTAIRRKFNLEGSCEALHRSCGCCGSCVEDEVQRERCESGCDMLTHVLCHPCALCQEGRELRRRLPHPGFNAHPVLVMIPPGEQSMARGA